MAPGPEDPQHLRHVQRVDGVTGEPAGSDDHVIGLLAQSSREDAINIAANVIPVEPERLEPVESGNVSIQGVNVGKSSCLQQSGDDSRASSNVKNLRVTRNMELGWMLVEGNN